jgi:hypothetical protein
MPSHTKNHQKQLERNWMMGHAMKQYKGKYLAEVFMQILLI